MKAAGITALLTTLGALAAAQQPETQYRPQPQPPPAFRGGTDLVAVDIIVQDKQGRSVTDLKPEDFEVREESKPQRIEQFYVVGGPPPPSGTAVGAISEPGSTSIGKRPPRVFIVVFDDAHLTAAGFKRVQSAALMLFSTQFRTDDVGAVVVAGQIANKRLTGDREELLSAVKNAKPNSNLASRQVDIRQWPSMNEVEAFEIVRNGLTDNPVMNDVVRRACTEDPDACKNIDPRQPILEKAQRMTNDIRVSSERTLYTLSSLLSGLERIDGRKTILLLSEGFITEQSWPIVQQTTGLAARANARIYALDARGLRARNFSDFAPHDDTLGNLLASFDIGADSINSLAVNTGGFVVRNANIFDKAVQQIAQEATTYYVLGYRPDTAPDGKFRRIAVRVTRPGLIVRARRGYVATSRIAPTTTPDPARASAAIPQSPAEPTPAPTASPVAAAPPAGAEAVPASPLAAPAAATTLPTGSSSEARAAEPSTAIAARLRPDAVKHVEALASDASEDADATSGWTAYQRGDLEAARASFIAAAARPSARPWVHYALGQSEHALRQYQAAIDQWELVRSSAPEFEPVYFDLVDGYLQTKDHDKAIRVLRAAKDRWPRDPDVFNALGVVQVSRGALDDAVGSFQQAIAVSPDESVGYFNLAKVLELQYNRSRRYIAQTRSWVANEAARTGAIANYTRYLEIGGPYEESARQGITRLSWAIAK